MQGHDYEFSAMHRERVRDIQRALTGQTGTPARPRRREQRVAETRSVAVSREGDLRTVRPGGSHRGMRRLVARLAAALVLTGTTLHRWADAR